MFTTRSLAAVPAGTSSGTVSSTPVWLTVLGVIGPAIEGPSSDDSTNASHTGTEMGLASPYVLAPGVGVVNLVKVGS